MSREPECCQHVGRNPFTGADIYCGHPEEDHPDLDVGHRYEGHSATVLRVLARLALLVGAGGSLMILLAMIGALG